MYVCVCVIWQPTGNEPSPDVSSPKVIFRSKEFDDVQKAKYRWTIAALKLGFNCTFIDNDIAILRDFYPLLRTTGSTTEKHTVYALS